MTAADDTRLRLTDVGVRYAGRAAPALTGIDLEVRSGEQLGITGRLGAGASTLALLAGGFIPRVVHAAVTGTTVIDGVDIGRSTHADALLGRVGIVFATPANQLSGSKPTVREELAFGLENLGIAREAMDARIDDVLGRLGIAHLGERDPFDLSGGEQQRVAIASIVAMGPRLLVLDDPTAQLDPLGRTEVGVLLEELARDGTSVVRIEHDADALARMDRVGVLADGRLTGIDRPGVALGAAIAGRAGLPIPPLLALATWAGVVDAAAFDPSAVASAVARTLGAGAPPAPSVAAGDAAAAPWAPSGDRPVPPIELVDIRHRYATGIVAVDGVSLRIEHGETVAIVGQNGSGKTTLVKHLDGLLRPTNGEVRLDGRSIADRPVHELAGTVGFAFQDPRDQLFERTVEREIAFGPRNLGLARHRVASLVDEALDAVGLEAERTTNPYDLDVARRKLVGLAATLATDPAILVLDEPTTGQDADGIARVAAIIRGWQAAGRTTVAITHDMAFASAAFDRVIVLRDGRVVADGPPARVLSAEPAARGLLHSTGLEAPPLARLAAALGIAAAPTDLAALIAAARGTSGSPRSGIPPGPT